MITKETVVSEYAPKAIGPYSVAVTLNNLVFTAGQLGIDPNTGELVAGGIEEETRQALTNLKNVLEAAGSSLENVLKTTVFLKDIQEFGQMNLIYGSFFQEKHPARSAVQVAALPKNGSVEIEAIAFISSDD
jgi:2-iminobutanoate/2-iminopropanoate deaminase